MTIRAGEVPATYSLSEGFLGGEIFEIDADQYVTLSKALTIVVSAMEIEELFQIFAQSFLRFEKDILEISFDYAFQNMGDAYVEVFFSNVRSRLNVSIITILTAYKSYDDHCNRILKSWNEQIKAKDFNDEKRGEVFDTHLSYRICAALRNYAQHRELPLGGYSIGGNTNIGRNDAGMLGKRDTGFSISPWLNVSKLKNSTQCKAKLREELENLGYEKINMTWLIRSFAGAMYKRHAALREFLKPEIEVAGKEIAAGYEVASTAKKNEAKFLELCKGDTKRPMRNDLAEKVLKEFKTYTSLQRIERSYVTSQIRPEAATYSGQRD